MTRCRQMQNGLQRCNLSDGHKGPCSFVLRRSFQLTLSFREAVLTVKMAERERRRCVREAERAKRLGWKPEQGQLDINASRERLLEGIIAQLKPALIKADPQYAQRMGWTT